MKTFAMIMATTLLGCGAVPNPLGRSAGDGAPAPTPAPATTDAPAPAPASSPATPAPEATPTVDPGVVLVDYQRKGYLFAARVEARRGDQVDVVYFDDTRETVGAAQVLAFDWAAGSAVECDHDQAWRAARILEVGMSPPPPTLRIALDGGDEQTVHLRACRGKTEVALRAEEEQRRKEEAEIAARREEMEKHHAAGTWFHEKNYASFRKVSSLPKEKIRGEAMRREIAAAADYWLSGFGWEEAAYVEITGCRATGDWVKIGGEGARIADTVCVFEVKEDVCVARYDACRQEYLGGGEYAACVYRQTDREPPARIACGKAR